MKTVFQTLLLFVTTIALVWSQETKTQDNPLSRWSSVSCDTIIDQSVFTGDCCALNRTQGGGCLLSVTNGYCKVSSHNLIVFGTLYLDPI